MFYPERDSSLLPSRRVVPEYLFPFNRLLGPLFYRCSSLPTPLRPLEKTSNT